ncbi:Uma2 family endonuclease [Ferruginibacter sp. SUN106]|uniref:Uma2 family endonuclease n=1 Tax=Ferruginibacter sp. SUN106 TaxID=2978348 RepID=UPI003D35A730
MSSAIPKGDRKYTFAEYMAMEETSVEKHDFYHGEIFAMAGSSKSHNNIILNIAIALRTTKKVGCDVFIDGMKLEIEKNEFYVYPDLIYTCNDNIKGSDLYVKNPSIIFEVLSDSTALYDKEVKLKYYKRIESLNYYVLVAQKEIMVEVYSRINDSQIWQYQTFENLNETIEFERLGFVLPVSVIYENIGFEETEKS